MAGSIIASHNAKEIVSRQKKGVKMLQWVVIFLVIAVIAAVLGFTGMFGAAAWIAQTLFGLFLLLFVVGLILHLVRGSGTATP